MNSMMDSRTLFFALWILTVVNIPRHITASSNVTTEALDLTSTTSSNSVTTSSNSVTTGKGAKTSIKPTTPTTTPSTTQGPITCKVGSCNGSDECLKDTRTVKSVTCQSGEVCELEIRAINGTTSEYKFSCAASCSQEKGKVACCRTSNCKLDLNEMNNSGDSVSLKTFIAIFCLVIANVLAK